MDKQHLRDLKEIAQTIESRIKYLDTSGFDKSEIDYRKQECNILLQKVSKIRTHRQKPLESIETVQGTKFKIGDKFHIAGDTVSIYTIVLFPDSVTIRGQSANPAIGKPWTCEVYIESAFKVKKEKKVKVKKEKKRKPVKINVGDYFSHRNNNIIYKATKVKKDIVTGVNEMKRKEYRKTKVSTTDIILKTKKEYKKQCKAK